MSALVNRCSGDDAIRPGGPLYLGGSLMDTGLFLSLAAPSVDVYCPPLKRARVSAPVPFLVRAGGADTSACPPRRVCSLDALPDECLFEILRRLSGKQERSTAACVSRRWLMLLSTIRTSDIAAAASSDAVSQSSKNHPLPDLNEDPIVAANKAANVPESAVPDVARCLEGKEATDARLAAMAIRTEDALRKLSVRSSSSACCVTDLGLRAVARCCPSLRTLMMWDAPFIGDDGLAEVAAGCPLLEKLDLCQCPMVSDKGLLAVADKCPNLVSLTVESCSKITDKGLQGVAARFPKLQSLTIVNCPLVGDQGVSSLISSSSSSLKKIKLQGLSINDVTLGVVGYYGREVTDLVLNDLPCVAERGFWVMGNTHGLQKLTTFKITSCDGLTDLALEAVAKGCPALKQLCLQKALCLSDAGLKAFSRAAGSLESLRFEECNRITLGGLLGALQNCCGNLKTLSMSRCAGIRDVAAASSCSTLFLSSCDSLRSLSIRNCPGFQSSSMPVIGKLCPQLEHLDMRGLPGVTDAGLLKLVESCVAGLVKVNLSGCSDITDASISALAKIHGGTLDALSLEGCTKITDASLVALAANCTSLGNLDVSFSAVTDSGVAALASAKQLSLRVLSLAHCSKVSTRSLAFFGNFGQSLVGLNVQNCSLISTSAIGSLEEKMWWCDILS